MDTILSFLSNETVQISIGTLFGGSALTAVAAAVRMGFKPMSLVKGLFGKKKGNLIKELWDVFRAYKAAKDKKSDGGEEITNKEKRVILNALFDVFEAIEPMLRGKK